MTTPQAQPEITDATTNAALRPLTRADATSQRSNSEREVMLMPRVDEASSEPRALGSARWDWQQVRRVLIVRLRSIGDTVLSTPSLVALRRFLPDARIDLLLEDWVAPLVAGLTEVDRVVTVERESWRSRLSVARELRAARYDVAYNLHGGSTAALLMRASGARRRVGYADYR
jgi:hypothetical protein